MSRRLSSVGAHIGADSSQMQSSIGSPWPTGKTKAVDKQPKPPPMNFEHRRRMEAHRSMEQRAHLLCSAHMTRRVQSQ